MTRPLEGVFPLMPFVVDKNQELDLEGLRENIEYLSEAGIHGFIQFGSMGEFFQPNWEEFKKVVDVATDASEKIACVIGTSSQNTRECVRRTKYANDAGADGVMIVLPYVNPLKEDWAFEHFRQVNDAVDEIQIMVYNNLRIARGFNFTTDSWDRLMTLDRIKAVKESNHDIDHRRMVINHIAKRINVFSGCEPWFLTDSLYGAKGIVSLLGMAVPKLVLEYYEDCRKRDLEKAFKMHIKFGEALRDLTGENEVALLKECAEIAGRKAGPPRSPYGSLEIDARSRLEQLLRELGESSGKPENFKGGEN